MSREELSGGRRGEGEKERRRGRPREGRGHLVTELVAGDGEDGELLAELVDLVRNSKFQVEFSV